MRYPTGESNPEAGTAGITPQAPAAQYAIAKQYRKFVTTSRSFINELGHSRLASSTSLNPEIRPASEIGPIIHPKTGARLEANKIATVSRLAWVRAVPSGGSTTISIYGNVVRYRQIAAGTSQSSIIIIQPNASTFVFNSMAVINIGVWYRLCGARSASTCISGCVKAFVGWRGKL